jgi:homoserine O-acetyltransferase
MHTWLWGEKYPDLMDALVPMACQPTEMAARNWMTRRMLVDSVRNDPDYKDGNYTTQPGAVRFASVFFGIVTIGGSQAYYKLAPNREAADKVVAQRMAAPFTADANDFVYQWDASRDYNASPELERISAPLLAINSADDERNPSRAWHHGEGVEAGEERPTVSDPSQRGNSRARHHRDCEVLETAIAGVFAGVPRRSPR